MRPVRPDVLLAGLVGGTGGASRLMLELAVRLDARGLRTRIVVPDFETTRAYVERCRARDVNAEWTPWLHPRGGALAGLLDAARFVRGFRAPVVHYHFSENFAHHQLLRAMDLLKPPPALATVHSPYEEPAPGARMALRWAESAPRHFHRVICVAEWARRLQIAYGLPAAMVGRISNGVDLERMRSGTAARARAELGVGPDVPLISVIARIASQKRPVEAVHAFAGLAAEYPDARLLFVGSGELEGAVSAAAAAAGLGARVHLLGQRADVADWLAATDVWLLPTEREGFSVGVIEAMAAGRAIASTRCPGNDEVLVDGRNALVVPVGDVTAMTAAIRRLLANPPLRDELGRAARADAEPYSLDAMADAYIACYDEMRKLSSV